MDMDKNTDMDMDRGMDMDMDMDNNMDVGMNIQICPISLENSDQYTIPDKTYVLSKRIGERWGGLNHPLNQPFSTKSRKSSKEFSALA